jgi:plastocyanin
MRTFVIAFCAALALTGAAVAQSPSPSPKPDAVPTAVAAPGATVHIKNFVFTPSPVTIKVGQSVEWIEDDDTAHTVTAVDASYDSGTIDKGGTYVHTYTKAGTYPYYCSFHTYMKGTVIVK